MSVVEPLKTRSIQFAEPDGPKGMRCSIGDSRRSGSDRKGSFAGTLKVFDPFEASHIPKLGRASGQERVRVLARERQDPRTVRQRDIDVLP